MNAQPLQPFALPSGLASFSLNLSQTGALETLLALIFGIWLIFTLVAIYHWLKYSHGSILSLPAIFIHLTISIALMSFALTGNPIPTL